MLQEASDAEKGPRQARKAGAASGRRERAEKAEIAGKISRTTAEQRGSKGNRAKACTGQRGSHGSNSGSSGPRGSSKAGETPSQAAPPKIKPPGEGGVVGRERGALRGHPSAQIQAKGKNKMESPPTLQVIPKGEKKNL